MSERPAFYAPTGSRWGDFVSLLHIPYTLWHLAYAAIGAALAPELDWRILAGTLTAFGFGLGIGAHALDEVKTRPLRTGFSDLALWVLGLGAMAATLGIAALGALEVSPWVYAWAAAGVLLAVGYALEWPVVHTDFGFAVSWGAFPVIVGYWAQARTVSVAVVVVALSAILLSLAQRALSTPARFVRRRTTESLVSFDGDRNWRREDLLATWERPLRLLTWTTVVIAIGLLATHL
ncbi:MAG: hypothetical protein ACFCU2_09400 [Acidimicrobiia bacterium]